MDVLILFPSRHIRAYMCCRIFVCNKLWNWWGFLYLQPCHQKPTAVGYLDVKCHIKLTLMFSARASVACVWKSCFAQVWDRKLSDPRPPEIKSSMHFKVRLCSSLSHHPNCGKCPTFHWSCTDPIMKVNEYVNRSSCQTFWQREKSNCTRVAGKVMKITAGCMNT